MTKEHLQDPQAVENFNKRWGRLYWVFAGLCTASCFAIVWFDNQYVLGRVEDGYNFIRWLIFMGIMAPLLQIFIQNPRARSLMRRHPDQGKANGFGLIEAIFTWTIFSVLGWISAAFVPNQDEAMLARQISGHIHTISREEGVSPEELIQAQRWLGDRKLTSANMEYIQTLAQASSHDADRHLMSILDNSGVRGPEIDFFRRTGLVRMSDLETLVNTYQGRDDE